MLRRIEIVPRSDDRQPVRRRHLRANAGLRSRRCR
jgi:hypothetical protein